MSSGLGLDWEAPPDVPTCPRDIENPSLQRLLPPGVSALDSRDHSHRLFRKYSKCLSYILRNYAFILVISHPGKI